MGTTEFEEATILLPSAERTNILRALREAANAHHVAVRQVAIDLHKRIGTRSPSKYENAVRWVENTNRVSQDVFWDAVSVLDSLSHRKTIRVPTVADVETRAPKATNKTTEFSFGELTVTVNDRTITWDTGENNNAVRDARESWLGKALFAALEKITWTRGTGGYGIGNDEHNRDSRYEGGGSNYVTFRYGPLGGKWGW